MFGPTPSRRGRGWRERGAKSVYVVIDRVMCLGSFALHYGDSVIKMGPSRWRPARKPRPGPLMGVAVVTERFSGVI